MWGDIGRRAKRTEESSSSSSSADNGRFVVRHPALRLGLPDIRLELNCSTIDYTRERAVSIRPQKAERKKNRFVSLLIVVIKEGGKEGEKGVIFSAALV